MSYRAEFIVSLTKSKYYFELKFKQALRNTDVLHPFSSHINKGNNNNQCHNT